MAGPIAIVGVSCRFPGGVENPEDFWQLLEQSKNARSKTPHDRFNEDSFYHPDPDNYTAIDARGGHFLEQDVGLFDAGFFGISPAEAASIDPQQRIQLESAYEALEAAGVPLESLRGSKTAVYIATYGHDYESMMFHDTSHVAKYSATAVGLASAANRISYLLDLQGPSFALDCGCSGGLVAVHQACQSLILGESDMAIAGGTNLILSPNHTMALNNIRALSQDGMTFPFDGRGSGYGRGEGTATVVLKRLDDALKSKDPIRAIIRGTAVNQDGKTNGMTLPSADAQTRLIQTAYESAGLSPDDTAFVEAHGTGTKAGDTAEVDAFKMAFGQRSHDNILRLGSVKGNIGHLENASGFASLIKATLMLEKQLIPPTANFEKLKDGINLAGFHFSIPTELETALRERPGRISVHNLGYGGTNAHMILEESSAANKIAACKTGSREYASVANEIELARTEGADNSEGSSQVDGGDTHTTEGQSTPATDVELGKESGFMAAKLEASYLSLHQTYPQDPSSQTTISDINGHPYLFNLTARTEKSLSVLSQRLFEWLSARKPGAELLSDLSYTLLCRRTAMQWRRSLVASTFEELQKELSSSAKKAAKVSGTGPSSLTFIFTGQGAQWCGMGRELLQVPGRFRESLRQSSAILSRFGATWDLLEELHKDETISQINSSDVSQPACTAIQIALVDLFTSFNIRPNMALGHSSGEIAVAYALGALSHEQSLLVSYRRGCITRRLKEQLPYKGAMLAVSLGADDILQRFASLFTDRRIQVACINSPSNTTIAGDEDRILALKESLDKSAVFCRKLKVDTAYHSHHMQAVAEEYLTSMSDLQPSSPRQGMMFFSSVTGKEEVGTFDARYWVANLTSPVNFSGALQELCKAGSSQRLFVEIGPHGALAAPIRQTLIASEHSQTSDYISALDRKQSAVRSVLSAAGKLFENGLPIDLEQVKTLSRPSSSSCKTLTDLPTYPWDHSARHWHESRLSKENRLRPRPWHDLLGLRLPTSSASRPAWRYVVDSRSTPWLEEHVVHGVAIMSAASFICMAIEAAKQVCLERLTTSVVKSYKLRDLVFSESLPIPTAPSKLELQLTMSLNTMDNLNYGAIDFGSFVVSSVTPTGSWTDHCRGCITLELDQPTDEVDDQIEKSKSSESSPAENGYRRALNSTELYDELRSKGNNYGPRFANISQLQIGDRSVYGTVKIPNIASSMPANFMQPHVVHPTTLDTMLQAILPRYYEALPSSSVVTASIDEMFISADAFVNEPGSELGLFADIAIEKDNSAAAQISAFSSTDDQKAKVLLRMRDAVLRGIQSSAHSPQEIERDLSYQVGWKADIDNLELKTPELSADPEAMIAADNLRKMDRAACLFARAALQKVSFGQIKIEEHQLFFRWMQSFTTSDYGKELVANLEPQDHATAFDEAAQAGTEGQLLCRIGPMLPQILTGEQEPLEVMLDGGLLNRVYAENRTLERAYEHLSTYMQSLTFKNPSMTILEAGGGTGGATLPLLTSLSEDGVVNPFRSYTFTDISSGFFEKAREKLQKWEKVLVFKTLDADKDPLEQGFQVGHYDVIIAANVFHVTEDIDKTVAFVRALLKPGGKLVIIETFKAIPFYNAIFGLLKSWWIGRKHGREGSPMLTEEQWKATLQRCGFNGLEKVAYDYDGPARRGGLIVSTAIDMPSAPVPHPRKIELIVSPQVESSHSSVLQTIKHTFHDANVDVVASAQPPSNPASEIIYILIEDAGNPMLRDPDEATMSDLTNLMVIAKFVLWISITRDKDLQTIPELGLTTGFTRSIRLENNLLKLVHLAASISINTQRDLSNKIFEVLNNSFLNPAESSQPEVEYRYQNGKLEVPRLLPDTEVDRHLAGLKKKSEMSTSLFRQPSNPLKLHVGTYGMMESLHFVSDESALRALARDEVKIQVEACGINFRDVLIALGTMKLSGMVGEFAGIVTQVGPDAEHDFKVGDRVCGWGGTPYASYVTVDKKTICRIPQPLSFTVAASIPVVFATAYHGLVDIAGLEEGQTVLIHSAAGGVGQAAIKLAKYLGATVFATVGSTAKRDLLISQYAIPRHHFFSSRTGSFKEGILKLTEGKGVDVVLNSLSGQALRDSWACIAPFGTFVELGKKDIKSKGVLNLVEFDKHVTFASIDLSLLLKHKPRRAGKLLTDVLAMFESGALTPTEPVTVHQMTDIEDAFRLLQSRKHTGKVVLEAQENTKVKAVVKRDSSSLLNADGTYIIAGGAGGLGSEICRLMARCGARHIVVLSRRFSTLEQQNATKKRLGLESEVELRLVKCDIGKQETVQEVASSLAGMPAVKGVVQAAVGWNDIPLSLMTADDLQIPLRAKMHGTKNLATAFNTPTLDFFIMLSSIMSITGNVNQANYTASNAFMDAFAQSQPQQQHAHFISLNLGPVEGIGLLATNPNLQIHMQRLGFPLVQPAEMLALLEYAMSPAARADNRRQIVYGLQGSTMANSHNAALLEKNAMFAHLKRAVLAEHISNGSSSSASASASTSDADAAERIRAAAGEPEQQHAIIADLVSRKLANLLALDLEALDRGAPLSGMGLDSLVYIELSSWIANRMRLQVQVAELTQARDLEALAGVLVEKVRS